MDTDAITLKVKHEFAAKEKRKLTSKSVAQLVPKTRTAT